MELELATLPDILAEIKRRQVENNRAVLLIVSDYEKQESTYVAKNIRQQEIEFARLVADHLERIGKNKQGDS